MHYPEGTYWDDYCEECGCWLYDGVEYQSGICDPCWDYDMGWYI